MIDRSVWLEFILGVYLEEVTNLTLSFSSYVTFKHDPDPAVPQSVYKGGPYTVAQVVEGYLYAPLLHHPCQVNLPIWYGCAKSRPRDKWPPQRASSVLKHLLPKSLKYLINP